MNRDNERRYEIGRKIKEYEMKITKMAGYLSDYYIDRALESDDFSEISSFLIDYFSSGSIGKSFDVGYLVSKYKEYELDEKIEDIDFDIAEWYKVKYDVDHDVKGMTPMERHLIEMTEDEYIKYMIDKRKKELEE